MVGEISDLRQRFFAKVVEKDGCWVWTGALAPDGYPRSMSVKGRRYRVSHIALTIAGKPRPDQMLWALHSCDNPSCVNPDHLRWGTELENREDAIARWKGKGRSFSPDEVRYIRASPKRHFQLAGEFGVSTACICQIRKRVTHHHVD